jgi:hypothetical protein
VDHSVVGERDLKTLLGIAARAAVADFGEPFPQFVSAHQ